MYSHRTARMAFQKTLTFSLSLSVLCVSAFAGLSVDTSSREESRVFYNAVYPASENVAIGWTGSLNSTGASAGTTSAAFKESVFLRVNFFRALAGVPADITENTDWSSKAQAGALMMSANKALNHNPPTSWKYYTAAGATAAGNSNLALGNFGTKAIAGYMEDPGSNNGPVGHRRWLLFPNTQQMGTGDIPNVTNYFSSNALWVIDTNHFADPRPEVRDDFVAWPPPGFVPYTLIYPRWSFSFPGADFSNAYVTVQRNGVDLPVNIENRTPGYGENSIIFIPENLNPNSWAGPVAPLVDTTTTVTVGNVMINSVPETFTYDVTSFDPTKPGIDTPSTIIEGSATPTSGVSNSYFIPEQVKATGYQWRLSGTASYTTVTTAESTGEGTSTGFAIRDKYTKVAGYYSYHLAHPNFTPSSFVLKNSVICSPTTSISFYSRLTYSTSYQTARIEVSTDEGKIWQSVWSQSGKNSAGEKSFTKRTVSLAAFAGKEIKVRLAYDLSFGSAYTQTAGGVGWYVDNIAFTNAGKFATPVTSAIAPNTTYSLTPQFGKTYALQVRAQVYGKYFLGWSNVKVVTGN